MRSSEDKKKFLAALEETALVYTAAKRAGINRATIYRWKRTNAQFAKEMAVAKRRGRADKNDFAEGKLFLMMQAGSFPATKFYLENNHPQYIKPRREIDPVSIKLAEQTQKLNALIEEVRIKDDT